MQRRLQAFLVSALCAGALPAAAQELSAEGSADLGDDPGASEASEEPPPEEAPETPPPDPSTDDSSSDASSEESSANAEVSFRMGASEPDPDETPSGGDPDEAEPDEPEGWQTSLSGYFRAPMAIGLSPRLGPDEMDSDADPSLQLSYGPTRTVDANYYSFAYTRLQEQDWVEVFVNAKKKHVEAAVGWMGYWLQSAGFRNPDASWGPGMAYLKLDTDFDVGSIQPNIALTSGAWWPRFGYHEKYDTYTLGQFRHVGEQLKLTIPVSSDFTATLTQGFGTGRDGIFTIGSPPPYQASVGLTLLHYEHLQLTFGEHVDLGLHYNNQWTRDPNRFQTTSPGKSFTSAKKADLTTIGGEVTLRAPYAGSLWVSPSYISLQNGWALANAGVEVMHSLAGEGLATNYFGWSDSLSDSTGSGKLFNVGFHYKNTLSSVTGKEPGSVPEVTLNLFGLFADVQLDLPEGSSITQDRIGQFKYGADVEYQPLDWLGLMLRWDEANLNLGHSGYVFSAISPRVTFSSHYLSGESIYIQYSRYRYGGNMGLAGQWPWGTPIVAGSSITQGGAYNNDAPDMDVLRVQASIVF